MICKDYQCIFVHIPKTAGQSIEHFFLNLLGLTWQTRSPLLLRPNSDPQLGPPTLAHLKASEYVSCGHVIQEDFDSYFKFSFVRNPWVRLLSHYNYRRRHGFYAGIDFKTFLFKHFPEPSWNDLYIHTVPQYDFLFDEDGNQLVDFIGRFENLQKDFDEVCQQLGIQQNTLPRVNVSATQTSHSFPGKMKLLLKKISNKLHLKKQKAKNTHSYVESYDDESREFVENLYKRDIETFKYSFGE